MFKNYCPYAIVHALFHKKAKSGNESCLYHHLRFAKTHKANKYNNSHPLLVWLLLSIIHAL